MIELQVDLLVIGWGEAGKTIASTLGRQGQKVVMVEQSEEMYGGTCINIACVPTKALVHQAQERRVTDDAQTWFDNAQSDLVLGAALFCVDSQEMINLISLAIRNGVTATDLRDSIYIHPSSTEALNEVLVALA